MKQAIFWKQIDLAGQTLMLLPLIALASPDARGYALFTYFSVGAWQTGSCLLCHSKTVSADRRSYELVLRWLLGLPIITMLIIGLCQLAGPLFCGIQSLFGALLLLEGLCLLLISPFIAFWYARLTMDELSALKGALKHRAEVHWKL